jgi:galactitol-specific phosphotransferase system IIB component
MKKKNGISPEIIQQKACDHEVHMRHCNKGENEGSCKYGDINCPALREKREIEKQSVKKVTIVDFFDPYNIHHLVAYRHLEKTGFWPEDFYPENVEWPMIWQAALTAKMTEAWLKLAEEGKIAGMKR